MINAAHTKRRCLLGLAAMLPASALILVPTTTSTAAAATGAVAPPAPRPAKAPRPAMAGQFADHSLGSQIRRHELTGAEVEAEAPVDTAALGLKNVVRGLDVSRHQGKVDWNHWWRRGKRFVWVKATEGTGYRNQFFTQQYNGSYRRGFIRGAYHFALPDQSSGAAQARYFSRHGGGWSADGKTLPGVIDMEYNPYGPTCYGKSKKAMAKWVNDFSRTYHATWGRWPVIYTSRSWWNQCVGDKSGKIGTRNPLWLARYAKRPGALPHGWKTWRFWQYSSTPIDQNLFKGSRKQLVRFATRRD